MNFDDELMGLIERAVADGVDVHLVLGSLDRRREELLCQLIWAEQRRRSALAKTAERIAGAQNGEGAPE